MGQDAPGVVVFGTSFGCFTHVRALRNAGFQVRAVVGRDPEKTRRRAKAFDVPLALVSVDEALALPDVQAVTIATPPHTHAAIAMKAIMFKISDTTLLEGVHTTIPFLRKVLNHPEFVAGDIDTGFVERFLGDA